MKLNNPSPIMGSPFIESYKWQLGRALPLPAPKLNLPGSYFFEVLEKRHSERHFECLDLTIISTLLYYSFRLVPVGIAQNGLINFHSPSPSAGGIHEIDVIVSFPGKGNKRDFYLYFPIHNCLQRLLLPKKLLDFFLKDINSCLAISEAAIFWNIGDERKLASVYANYESLMWRNAGHKQATLQLVATALGLKSCAVGTLGEPHFSKMFSVRMKSLGGVLIGR